MLHFISVQPISVVGELDSGRIFTQVWRIIYCGTTNVVHHLLEVQNSNNGATLDQENGLPSEDVGVN